MLKETIEILADEKCTGCGACFNKCPVRAITMEYNQEGFLFPKVDSQKCIQCGVCQKVCPELQIERTSQMIHPEGQCYAMMADDEIRAVSSSGGMFTLLAEYVLDKGGVVCGAAYSDDYMTVKHIVVSSKEELAKLRGSKYVQSDINNTYLQVERYLKSEKYVLYSGCPCQIAGLRSYLQKEYENLILVDIICHGTPSPKIYQKYVNEISQGRKLKKVDFREKAYWGWGTASSLFFEDNSVYRQDYIKDGYWRAFLEGISTRKCCGTCRYANPKRVGDFTLGDFWGVADIDKSCDDKKGTSLVMINTKKAKAIFKDIITRCKLIKFINKKEVLDLAKTRNGQLLNPTKSYWARKRFFELTNIKSFNDSVQYTRENFYDVGVTGWWYNDNYGGTLTYFALHQVLKKMGLSVLMIAKCSPDKNYKPRYESISYRFAVKNYYISKNYTPENIGILNQHCKTFISGSDQLFNPTLWEYSGPQYFLNYVSEKNNLVSYASSFGNSFYDNKNLTIPMSYWLHRFNAISVREDYAVKIANDVFGLKAEKVLDPVFLCDVEEYEKQAQKSGKVKNQDYMLNFFLDPDDKKREAVLKLSKHLGLPYVNLLDAVNFEQNEKALSLENTKPNIDVEEWLFYYKNADFIITDSFHGTCFAIIFRKKFISIANFKRGENRFISILKEAGLMDRLIRDTKEIDERPDLFCDIDYDNVYSLLNPHIKKSYEWLENAIKHPQKKEADLFNMLNYEIEQLKKEIVALKNNTTNS